MFKRLNTFFILIGALIGAISAIDSSLSKDEIMGLTRDGLSRANPDTPLNGFMAAWPAVLWILSATFFVMAVFGFLGYVTGACRNPEEDYEEEVEA